MKLCGDRNAQYNVGQQNMNRILFALLFVLISSPGIAGETNLVTAYPKVCKQGLYQQPAGGPFSVFLFCDDALGSNIGVVNTSGGAGPGKIQLPQPKTWDKWEVNDRFWQQADWATDVTSFAWSPDLKFLYVGTSEVYGTGALYKLDLVKRTYKKLLPDTRTLLDQNHSYTTEIKSLDKKTGELVVQLETFLEPPQKSEVVTVRIK